MRIAIVGPFTGSSLASSFSFPAGTHLPDGYLGAPLMAAYARALVNRGHIVAAITTDKSTFPAAARGPSSRSSMARDCGPTSALSASRASAIRMATSARRSTCSHSSGAA